MRGESIVGALYVGFAFWWLGGECGVSVANNGRWSGVEIGAEVLVFKKM